MGFRKNFFRVPEKAYVVASNKQTKKAKTKKLYLQHELKHAIRGNSPKTVPVPWGEGNRKPVVSGCLQFYMLLDYLHIPSP